jgi:hypothetical protein
VTTTDASGRFGFDSERGWSVFILGITDAPFPVTVLSACVDGNRVAATWLRPNEDLSEVTLQAQPRSSVVTAWPPGPVPIKIPDSRYGIALCPSSPSDPTIAKAAP